MKPPTARERKNILADRRTEFDDTVTVALQVGTEEYDEHALGGAPACPERRNPPSRRPSLKLM